MTMDEAGYFVIILLKYKGVVNLEHYAYDNSLLRVVEGPTVRGQFTIRFCKKIKICSTVALHMDPLGRIFFKFI
ncbi:MAG: hypothetical protein PVI39_01115, partial [Desulfobacteraceae bacterium]